MQSKVATSFVPLEVAIEPGTERLPLDWPALQGWRLAYRLMGGEDCEGFTGCSVVTPDLKTQLGNTGSAMVWEMFDSIAYDAHRFDGMLDRAKDHWEDRQRIESDASLSWLQRYGQRRAWRSRVRKTLREAGRMRLPPKGFTKEGARVLFEMTGDLPVSRGSADRRRPGGV
ncbi:MAG: hypothetical protein AAF196_01035 [Planctomycetota bacterium]